MFAIGAAFGAWAMVAVFAAFRPKPQPRDERGRFVRRS